MMHVEVIYRGDARAAAKKLRGIVSAAMGKAIQWWHRSILPKHFETGAPQRYGYAARTRSYRRAKLRRMGTTKPLVFTGELRRRVLRSIEVRTLKTKATATGRIQGPRYLYMVKSMWYEHNLGDELTRTTKGEARTLARLVDRFSTKALNKLPDKRTKKLI